MQKLLRLLMLTILAAGAAALVKSLSERRAEAEWAGSPPATGMGEDHGRADDAGGHGGTGGSANGAAGATREQLYQEAQRLEIQGRSKMNKAELRRAVEDARR